MPLKVKEKHLLYQPNWRDIHFKLVQSHKDQLAVELRYREGKETKIAILQGDQIKHIGKDRMVAIQDEIAYVIGYEDILAHRYIEKDKNNLNQETEKAE